MCLLDSFKIRYVDHIIFLLDSAALEHDSQGLTFSDKQTRVLVTSTKLKSNEENSITEQLVS